MKTNATEVRMKKVNKTFHTLRGKVNVLKSLDLTIEPGEFFVLLGPSGCGKSTTLNLIAGLEKPSGGSIQFSNHTVADSSKGLFMQPFERDVSFVFQSYALYPHMTIEQNIEFPLTNLKQKMSKNERRRRVRETAEILRIENLLDRKPSELSGGQRQRVAIGRAIVRNPSLFLMDEPLSNLDAKLRMEMRAELKSLQKKLGITTIYVTHDQIEAMTLGDRIAVLENGYIQQLGTPEQIYSRPENSFVAKFIGSPPMNILKGEALEKENILYFKTPDLQIRIREPLATRLLQHKGEKLLLGVRPETAAIVEENADTNISFDVVENIGHEWLLHSFMNNGGKFITVTSKRPDKLNNVPLSLDMNRLHLFHPETKQRL
ncbi:MAG: ABC transporter ATP-binding protein [Chitinispirillaceae bacterium]